MTLVSASKHGVDNRLEFGNFFKRREGALVEKSKSTGHKLYVSYLK